MKVVFLLITSLFIFAQSITVAQSSASSSSAYPFRDVLCLSDAGKLRCAIITTDAKSNPTTTEARETSSAFSNANALLLNSLLPGEESHFLVRVNNQTDAALRMSGEVELQSNVAPSKYLPQVVFYPNDLESRGAGARVRARQTSSVPPNTPPAQLSQALRTITLPQHQASTVLGSISLPKEFAHSPKNSSSEFSVSLVISSEHGAQVIDLTPQNTPNVLGVTHELAGNVLSREAIIAVLASVGLFLLFLLLRALRKYFFGRLYSNCGSNDILS